MKHLIFLSVFLYSTNACFSQTDVEIITNETIIKLSKSNIPESIIISKINQSNVSFDIGVDALITLKENSVSDNVINLMLQKQSNTNTLNKTLIKSNTNDRNYTFTETGIYFFEDNRYVNLDPTIVSTTNPGGFTSLKFKSQLEGEEANYQVNSRRPVFYFNFEPTTKSLNNANANSTNSNRENYLEMLFSQMGMANSNYQAISPNDFKLLRLARKKGKREFDAGKIGFFGQMDMSISSKNITTFKYEKVSTNTYKIIFSEDLEPGEYCFHYLGNNKNPYLGVGQNNIKVFDFGVRK